MAHILVVDDEETIRQVLEALLTSNGHTVHQAAEGGEAIEYMKTGSDLDLVVTDMRMDPVNGMDVLVATKEHRSEVPVIMVTAFASDETSAEAMDKGAFAYLSKPFNPTQLMERVDRALSAAS